MLKLLWLIGLGAVLLSLSGASCQSARRVSRSGSVITTARALKGANLIGGTEIDTGRYVLLSYERRFDIPHHSDVWSDNVVFIKLQQLDALPLGQPVAVPGTAAVVSGYLESTWYFENRQAIRGTITRLASTSAGHRLKLSLHYTNPKNQPAALVEGTVWFRHDSTYFQVRHMDYHGKYEDLRLALKEPDKVKALDLTTYAIQFEQRNGSKKGPDTLYRHLGELYNLEELSLQHSHLTDLPSGMRKLKRLKRLDLSYNQFAAFPELLFALDSLQELNLEWNQLDSIPAAVVALRRLTKLNLGNNHLDHYPTTVNALTGLQELTLANANLRVVPKQIQQLTNLEVLNLDGFWNSKRRNRLQDISALYGLLKLRSLSLKDNGTIAKLAAQLYQMPGLEQLNLEWNGSEAAALDTTRFAKMKRLKR